MTRISIPVDAETKAALIMLARKELREPRYQAALLIRDELTRRGLLPAEPIQPTADPAPSPIQTAPAVMA